MESNANTTHKIRKAKAKKKITHMLILRINREKERVCEREVDKKRE